MRGRGWGGCSLLDEVSKAIQIAVGSHKCGGGGGNMDAPCRLGQKWHTEKKEIRREKLCGVEKPTGNRSP